MMKSKLPLSFGLFLFLAAFACSENGASPKDTDTDTDVDAGNDAGEDTERHDAKTPVYPEVDENGGSGNVTTYGSVSDPAPSIGGACNYGVTEILNFAAVNVSVRSGDGLGQWRLGKICGQCARVTVSTPEGYKSTVLRIVDKCPDEYCGIDLGGLPAQTLMGNLPGRYNGTWEFVPCDDHEKVSDGEPALYVKDGSNPWWALVQVRNPPAAVLSMDWALPDGTSGQFEYASEAENFYTVPEEVRTSEETVTLTVSFDFDISLTAQIKGSNLAVGDTEYPI